MDQQYIQIIITETIDAGHFWAQNADEITERNLFFINSVLNSCNKLPEIPKDEKVKVGQLYAAKYTVDDQYYRCKVLHIKPGTKTMAQVNNYQ